MIVTLMLRMNLLIERMDNWFCGVDKKDKRAYLISFDEIDENVFEDRKIALKRIHNAEQKYPQISGETYYEEY